MIFFGFLFACIPRQFSGVIPFKTFKWSENLRLKKIIWDMAWTDTQHFRSLPPASHISLKDRKMRSMSHFWSLQCKIFFITRGSKIQHNCWPWTLLKPVHSSMLHNFYEMPNAHVGLIWQLSVRAGFTCVRTAPENGRRK